MEYQDVLVRQYAAYIESKDKFVERSFNTNKFYMIFVLVLLFVTFGLKFCCGCGDKFLPLITLAALTGMAGCMLWWLNQDSYAYLIKIRLNVVLEKFEQHLPMQPHSLEYEEIKRRNEKKRVLFADMQKFVAFVSFALFFAMFLYNAGIWAIEILIPITTGV